MQSIYRDPYTEVGGFAAGQSADSFLEDYVLAQDLANTLEIPKPKETGEAIKQAVSARMGADAEPAEILAVSSLVCAAASRALRRSLISADKEVHHTGPKVWPLFRALKTNWGVSRERYNTSLRQAECAKANYYFYKEYVALQDGLA